MSSAKMHIFQILFVTLLSRLACLTKSGLRDLHSNEWVVHIKGGEDAARRVIATDDRFMFHGQLGGLTDYYLLEHRDLPKRSRRSATSRQFRLHSHPDVIWLEQQKVLSRKKRGYFHDPLFDDQWYLSDQGNRAT